MRGQMSFFPMVFAPASDPPWGPLCSNKINDASVQFSESTYLHNGLGREILQKSITIMESKAVPEIGYIPEMEHTKRISWSYALC